jgi:hypothetical protein
MIVGMDDNPWYGPGGLPAALVLKSTPERIAAIVNTLAPNEHELLYQPGWADLSSTGRDLAGHARHRRPRDDEPTRIAPVGAGRRWRHQADPVDDMSQPIYG